jgi:hypothetical protein
MDITLSVGQIQDTSVGYLLQWMDGCYDERYADGV